MLFVFFYYVCIYINYYIDIMYYYFSHVIQFKLSAEMYSRIYAWSVVIIVLNVKLQKFLSGVSYSWRNCWGFRLSPRFHQNRISLILRNTSGLTQLKIVVPLKWLLSRVTKFLRQRKRFYKNRYTYGLVPSRSYYVLLNSTVGTYATVIITLFP